MMHAVRAYGQVFLPSQPSVFWLALFGKIHPIPLLRWDKIQATGQDKSTEWAQAFLRKFTWRLKPIGQGPMNKTCSSIAG